MYKMYDKGFILTNEEAALKTPEKIIGIGGKLS